MTSLDSYVRCYTATVYFERWKKTNKAHLRCLTLDGHPHHRFTLCGVDAPYGAGTGEEYRYAASLDICINCDKIRRSLEQAQSGHDSHASGSTLGSEVNMQPSSSGSSTLP